MTTHRLERIPLDGSRPQQFDATLPTDHRPACRSPSTWLGLHVALGCLLTALLSLAGASSALAFPYTFTPVTGSPFTEAYFPHQIVFSPDGSLVATGSAYGFSVQPVSATGVLGPSAGGETAMSCPSKGKPASSMELESLAFSPNGKVIAAVEEERDSKGVLRTYSVAKSGATTLDHCMTDIGSAGPPPLGAVYSDAFSPAAAGGLLAVTNAEEDKLWVFTVTSAGKVYPLKGSPFYTGKYPTSVTFSPGGSSFEFLALVDAGENAVSVFTIGGGAVAPVPGSPFAVGKSLGSVAFSPGGALLAATEPGANAVAMFSLSYIGKLTAVPGSPFAAGKDPTSVAFSPDGTLLGVTEARNAIGNPGNELSLLSVSSTGALAPLSNSPLKTGAAPESVAFSPDGSVLASANAFGNSASVFTYGFSIAVPLPPWLSERLGEVLGSLGLGSEEARIRGLIGQALEEIHWGSGLKTATVHLVSKGTFAGREVAGRCVRRSAGNAQGPRCLGTVSVPVLTLVAHSVIHKVRIVRRHRLKPGSHTLVIGAVGPGVSSAPQALQATIVR